MNVVNLKEYITSLICLTGQLDIRELSSHENKTTLLQTVSILKSEGKIRKVKLGDENYLRLSYPKGDEFLKSISDDLLYNFCLVLGDKESLSQVEVSPKTSKRYKKIDKNKSRSIAIEKLILSFLSSGVKVNGLSLEKNHMNSFTGRTKKELSEGYFDEEGNPFKKINIPRERIFFTSRFFNLEAYHSKKDLTRCLGLFITGAGFYNAYFVLDENYLWNRKAESDFYYRAISKLIPRVKQEPRSLLIYKETETLKNYLKKYLTDNRLRLARPNDIFSKSHLVPREHFTKDYLDLLDNEEKVKEKVFKDFREIDKGHDALVNGVKVYFAFTLELSKLLLAKDEYERGGDLAVMCFPWQEEILRAFFEMDDDENIFIVRTEEEIRKEN